MKLKAKQNKKVSRDKKIKNSPFKKLSKKNLTEFLYDEAIEAQKKAYSPYSGYKVGAALLMDDGSIFNGCNVENASYGGTNCAERTAIFKAISESSSRKILEIVVVSEGPKPWPPCGLCLQVLSEFATPHTLIHLGLCLPSEKSHKKSPLISYSFKELLPNAFSLNQVRAD